MNSIIQHCDQDQFANGQSSRDLRVNSDLTEPETQLDVSATEQCPGPKPEEFPAPIGKLLGLKLLQAESGMAVVEFVADERHANPMGTLHGGVLCDIADAAMGFAYYTTLAADESFTTLELKINFLRPVSKATLRAKAGVVRAGQVRRVRRVRCRRRTEPACRACVQHLPDTAGTARRRTPATGAPNARI
jgi:uncharacterized protein (TIGR00369 family)